MASSILNSAHTLGNLGNVTNIGNWADAFDQKAQKGAENVKNGIKTVVDEIEQEDGRYRVLTTYKVIHKKVPCIVANRKNWKKFGASALDGPGPNVKTTYVAEEVPIQFVLNQAGESQEQHKEEKKIDQLKGYASRGHCRICKADDHWSVTCPYKEMYQVNEEENDMVDRNTSKTMGSTAGGRYVNPYARGDRVVASGMERRSDEFTCRITNLPEDFETLDEELRAMFGSVGRIERFYLARDKATNKPKGFAFVTYTNRQDTEKAIEQFNGYKMNHLILKVE